MASRVLADTSAWIELFRGTGHPVVRHLKTALREGWLCTTGLVRLELLAGARQKKDLDIIRGFLAKAVLLETREEDYEAAGLMTYALRRRGISTHAVDALIAAVAIRTGTPLLTADPDFRPLARSEGLRLIPIEP